MNGGFYSAGLSAGGERVEGLLGQRLVQLKIDMLCSRPLFFLASIYLLCFLDSWLELNQWEPVGG